MGKSKPNLTPYLPRLGVVERQVADWMAEGADITYDVRRGYYCNPITGASCQIDNAVAQRLLVKGVIKSNDDAMFGAAPQTYVFDPRCRR